MSILQTEKLRNALTHGFGIVFEAASLASSLRIELQTCARTLNNPRFSVFPLPLFSPSQVSTDLGGILII